MLEILKSIMDMSNDNRNTLLSFLDDKTLKQVEKYNLIEIDKLYLNDSLICINKGNLSIEHKGIVKVIDSNIVLNYNNYSRTIDPDNYYIFIKRRFIKKDNRIFFEELLKKL